MFWITFASGVGLIALAIEMHDSVPRPARAAVGLIGTALFITATFFM